MKKGDSSSLTPWRFEICRGCPCRGISHLTSFHQEELWNAITHGLMFLFSLFGTGYLMYKAWADGRWSEVAGLPTTRAGVGQSGAPHLGHGHLLLWPHLLLWASWKWIFRGWFQMGFFKTIFIILYTFTFYHLSITYSILVYLCSSLFVICVHSYACFVCFLLQGGLTGLHDFGFNVRSSTLYHSLFLYPMTGRVLQVLDHAAIYLLIAGTYTPFLLFYSDAW